VSRLSSLEHDEHAAALREMGIDLILTSRSQAEWSLDRIELKQLHIEFRAEGGSAIVAGISPPDAIVFAVLSAASSDDNLFNGHKVRAFDLIVIPPAQRFIQTALGPHRWTLVSLPIAALPGLDPVVRDEFNRMLDLGRVLVLRSRTLAQQIAGNAAAVADVMREPATVKVNGTVAELEVSLLDTLSAAALAAVERARHLPDFSRGRRAGSYEIAHRAAGAFHQPELVPQSVEDFCTALGATERKIRRAFKSFFGMGPAKLAKFHRLNRVRRMLVEGLPDNAKVMSVLSACDVTEFGRFAGEYKAIFGERPSDTLRRNFTIDSPNDAADAAPRRSGR